jgi:hypothetical protein
LGEHDPAIVADCLSRQFGAISSAERQSWRFKLPNEPRLEGTASMKNEDWLDFVIPLDKRPCRKRITAEYLRRALRWNALLSGGVKFALTQDRRQLVLAAEIPWDKALPLDRWLSAVNTGFGQALGRFSSASPDEADPDVGLSLSAPRQQTHAGEPLDLDLLRCCNEAGWAPVERPGGGLAVELETGGRFCEALVDRTENQDIRIRAVLADSPSIPAVSGDAVNVILLSASRLFRMARAITWANNGATAFGWEVLLPPSPSAHELACAFSALSVSCGETAREVEALLTHELVAQAFLTARGWSSPPSSRSPSSRKGESDDRRS